MTEKRFGVKTNECVYENKDGIEKWLNFDEIAEQLNNFAEENKILKETLKELLEIGDYQEGRIKELSKENMEYYQLVNCGNCKYHGYDWYLDDGDEFEVCNKGNGERLMYHKFCSEWEEL